MNIQQLEYILAVDQFRHFVSAADHCCVTQATLSTMVKKLEDEMGVSIFDRSKHPVIPTEIGEKILEQARVILREIQSLKNIVEEEKEEITGVLKLGIIPTLAPYLLPLFLDSFLGKYPNVKLQLSETTTEEILNKLERNEIDAGILAIPTGSSQFFETSLFFEEFLVYATSAENIMHKKYILPSDLDIHRLWLLEEGHCLRSQVINLCELKSDEKGLHQLDFTTGSIETLKKIVEAKQGITILPELAIKDLTDKQKENVRLFKSPAPVREIGIVTYRSQLKKKILTALTSEIVSNIPESMKELKQRTRLEINEN